jgi:Uma2 family endonuclease
MTVKTLLTADEYLSLTDDVRSELIRGEIVEMPQPGSRHGYVCGKVYYVLETWANSTGTGYAFTNDTAIQTEFDPDTVRGADVMFVARDRLPAGIPVGKMEATPNLCVEVLSPFDRWAEVLTKVAEYLDLGVDEVWIVDPARRWVERHRPDETSRRFAENEDLTDSPALPGFTSPVAAFFAGL